MTTAVENLINQALDAIGFPKHIGNIYEGSPAARVALEVYGQARDETLQMGEWPFAMREIVLTTNGQTAPTPWSFEYTYPADCLRIMYISPGPLTGGAQNNDPQPVLFRAFNDQRPGTPVRAILCSLATPVLFYVGRVTNPSTWEPEFTKALIANLGQKMSFGLQASAELIKARLALADQGFAEAQNVTDNAAPKPGMMTNAQQR